MNENIKNAVDHAFDNNVADMQAEIESALAYKIINAIEQERIEVAKSLINVGVTESKELVGKQKKLDVAEPKGKLTAADFIKLRKESDELDEKLTPDMTASEVIKDFVNSDDPKFAGKSKEERIKMALGAFYGMRKEGLEESEPSSGLSKKKKSMIVKKAKMGGDIGKAGKGFAAVEKAAEKYGADNPKAVAAAAMWKNIKR